MMIEFLKIFRHCVMPSVMSIMFVAHAWVIYALLDRAWVEYPNTDLIVLIAGAICIVIAFWKYFFLPAHNNLIASIERFIEVFETKPEG